MSQNKKQGGGMYRPLTGADQSLCPFEQLYAIAGHWTGGKELGKPKIYLTYLAFMGMAHLGHISGSPGL
jgi:hypothetical protein